MKESLDIIQKQQLTQRLSPRQVQYARLLEMTAPEVEDEVRRQLDDNPALEVAEHHDIDNQDSLSAAHDDDYDSADAEDDPADRLPQIYRQGESVALQLATIEEDMLQSLSDQIGEMDLSDIEERVALYMLGNLDENGYITRGLMAMRDDIMIATGLEVSDETMRKAFEAVRSLDPSGIGAVDLRDCLLLQLRTKPLSTPYIIEATEIVKDYFDLLSKKHYDRLQVQMGLKDREDLRQAIKLIRTLNPKPGAALHTSQAMIRSSHIVPDVAVEQLDDDTFSVSLVNTLPQLQIERTFAIDLDANEMRTKRDKEAQAFVRLKRDDAEAFISALKMRGNTLMRVTEAIVKRQPEFFATGDTALLHPMILRDIEADTGIELSSVSRATAGKYVATDTGTYPLKMLFNEAPREDSDMSSHQLMHALQQIVDQEDKRHPLSDQAILEAMEARGLKIARRTITKYREKMGIPVGRLRKKM